MEVEYISRKQMSIRIEKACSEVLRRKSEFEQSIKNICEKHGVSENTIRTITSTKRSY